MFFVRIYTSFVDSILMSLVIHIGIIVVVLEYVATSYCCLLSNTVFLPIVFFCLFSRVFRGQKKPDFDCSSSNTTIKFKQIMHLLYSN